MRIILGSSCIPNIPLLQGGIPHLTVRKGEKEIKFRV